ncbi:hypothetical protein GCM10009805_13640 [Leucobacter chromiireducens subsp. solipictus]
MTRHTPPASPFADWMPLTEYARAEGIHIGTARVRAWRSLSGRRDDPDFEFVRTAPGEPRSTVLARRRLHPRPPQ